MIESKPPRPAWEPTFLAHLAETRIVRRAAHEAGIGDSTPYGRRNRNPRFARAWDEALGIGPARDNRDERIGPAAARRAKRMARFLEALAETSNVAASAAQAKISTQRVYRIRRDEPEFAAAWRAALCEGYEHLEMEVLAYLRGNDSARKIDVANAIRLLAAHRETVARERALREDDDEQEVLESIDRFIDEMRERRMAHAALAIEDRSDEAG